MNTLLAKIVRGPVVLDSVLLGTCRQNTAKENRLQPGKEKELSGETGPVGYGQ